MAIELGSTQSELIKARIRSRGQFVVTPEQRRHLAGDLVAWAVVSSVLIVTWGLTGAGLFWPIFPIVGFGLGAVLVAAFCEPLEAIERGIEQARPSPTIIRSGPLEHWRASA